MGGLLVGSGQVLEAGDISGSGWVGSHNLDPLATLRLDMSSPEARTYVGM